MIRINVLHKDLIKKEYLKEEMLLHLFCVLCLLVLITYMQVSMSSKISSLNSRVSSLKKEIVKYENIKRQIAPLKEQSETLDKRLKVVETLQQVKIGPVHVLDEIAINLPEKRLWLNSLFLKEQGTLLALEGIALDNETIANFMRRLDSSPYFEATDLIASEQQVIDGIKLKRFNIQSRVSVPKAGT